MAGVYRNGVEVARDWPSIPGPEHTAVIFQDADRMPSINSALVSPLRYRTIPGIAYRLALVAAGEGEMAISLNGLKSRGVAAGHALLIGARGDLIDQIGKPVRYSRTGNLQNEISQCFGGSSEFCLPFIGRDWNTIVQNSGAIQARRFRPICSQGKRLQMPVC
jgi:ADP-ribosyl-[dinitrogen reductase] hydrolase